MDYSEIKTTMNVIQFYRDVNYNERIFQVAL